MIKDEMVFAAVFYAVAAATVLPAFAIFVSRDIVRQAFWLLATLGGIAGLYLMLGADFLGYTQILVYIGGIMVLLLFGVMLTQRGSAASPGRVKAARALPAGLAAIVLASAGAIVCVGASAPPTAALPVPAPTTAGLGVLLLSDYVLPFEVVSLVLLAALVGAAYIARRGTGENQ